jgi:predicted GTPase
MNAGTNSDCDAVELAPADFPLDRQAQSVHENLAPLPAVSGRRIKIRYMTQAKSRPPHFVIFVNQLDELRASYERFLVNGLRKAFDLPGVPIRISKKAGDNPYAGSGKS